ncbi:MAG TPA: Hsp70 family protein [Polyangia bacterium]|nr:Hsp70 family protein [Polyangia bacterium]
MRFAVGIDLGTTNSALAWIDLEARPRRLQVLEIPQLVAPGDVSRRPTLPSFLYLPGEHDLAQGAIALPWDGSPRDVVGELARSQGALVPGRLVASAKSWLCHPAVDRRAAILPWAASPEVERRSPLEVSARYLGHLAAAFLAETGVPLAETELVVTVPASFDEVARELTVEAAARVGLEKLTLLEEPQAAFYSWLADHGMGPGTGPGEAGRPDLPFTGGETLLVCDIGGGTTDFTLIRIAAGAAAEGGALGFERTAVGDHLLLGGDNMDLALARRVEKRLGGKLDVARFQALVQACRLAKERLLAVAEARETWKINVAGRGRGVVGGSLQAELSRQEIEEVVLEGFFPLVPADAAPAVDRRAAGLREFGLPYAQDAAVTRHLAAFLRRHEARPEAILFNGGVLTAPAIRERLVAAMRSWSGREPVVLENDVPHLAVARGAAYAVLARRGEGIRITGGAARAYYVEVEAPPADGSTALAPDTLVALCVSGRGEEEGGDVEVPGREFELITNRPVRFRLLSSSDRNDRRGDLVTVRPGELAELPPIVTVLRFPRSSQDVTLGVRLHVQRTELGTIDLKLVAPASGTRWKLAFDLRAAEEARAAGAAGAVSGDGVRGDGAGRGDGAAGESGAAPGHEAVGEAAREAAVEVVRRLFQKDHARPIEPAQAMKELAAAIGRERGEWPITLLRALWEPLRDLRGQRGRTAEHEARWLNLVGYVLRPGYGVALDDWRVKEAWRLFNAGMVHDKDNRVRLEWWILWRRVSGGLVRTMQDELYKRIAPHFLADFKKKGDRKDPSPQEAAEMWRTMASLERIAWNEKWKLGEVLLGRLEKKQKEAAQAAWALGRLGARVPLYGPIENVVSRHKAEKWVERLLKLDWNDPAGKDIAFATAEIARASGDRGRDLDESLRQRVAARLGQVYGQTPEGARLSRLVLEPLAFEAREERAAFGDALPIGLRLTTLEGRAVEEAGAPAP